jgi:DNA-binding HxlR family transcriptional regulator
MKPQEDILCVESIKTIMSIFGGKWAFVIISELRDGSRRFNELNRSIGLSTKSLSDSLKNLEKNGAIIRTVFSTTPVTVEYSLTEKGRDFEQVFLAMRDWGAKWLVN